MDCTTTAHDAHITEEGGEHSPPSLGLCAWILNAKSHPRNSFACAVRQYPKSKGSSLVAKFGLAFSRRFL